MRCRTVCSFLLTLAALVSPIAAIADEKDDLTELMTRMARVRACWSPTFSPDTNSLAFVSDLTGVPQVWLHHYGEPWPQPVTTLEDQVSSVSWSPSGEWLAFTLAPGGGMNQQIYLVRPGGSDLERITDGGKENNWLGKWSHDGSFLTLASNRDRPEAMNVYVYDLEARELELVVENPAIGYATDVSRDGKRMVLWRMESRGNDNLYLLDRETGQEQLLTPHEGPGSFGGGLFSPDASTVYLSSDADRDLSAFARVRISDDGKPGTIEVLASEDGAELRSFDVTDDGTTAALIWDDSGRSELQYLNLQTLAGISGPDLPAEIVGDPTFSTENRYLAFVASGSTSPSDIWVTDRETDMLIQVTFSPLAGVETRTLVKPELVHYKAHDGLELSGWLYRPRDVAGVAPYVISFHGGPEGQELPRFRSDYQAILATGVGVLAPNVRGSTGFGKRFENLDNGELRFDAIKDIEASVQYLVINGVADPKGIGIMGGSYGGYMTMAGLAWYPELFSAGANLFGVVNFETFFENTEPWMAAISTVEYGDPATQKDLLRELSPIHKLDRVKAPTIVLHGANDTNVPVVEAEQVVENLRERGIQVEYILFPDEGHGFRKTSNRIKSHVAVARWFAEHLKSKPEK